MTTADPIITIDEQPVPFKPGQTILQAALDAGVYIPHLCHHPEFAPHGSCKLCTIVVNGRHASACALRAAPGQEIEVDTPELHAYRRTLVQMLFVEGNHFCPGCEKSGNCQLQALGYEFEMMTAHFVHFFPNRQVDASHPDALLDFNRCILCELCVRASRDVDGKGVFALAGRGLASHLIVNSPSGKLGDSSFSISDKAAHVCPVGAILIKRVGFATPIGERLYDLEPISAEAAQCAIEEA
ncbi:MAG: 2Fe-2S iron-sulfur cluster-binding protein [Roseiarcus sp.]|jgi:[NiFe] hydrogenase diaphorase moiety small subunit